MCEDRFEIYSATEFKINRALVEPLLETRKGLIRRILVSGG